MAQQTLHVHPDGDGYWKLTDDRNGSAEAVFSRREEAIEHARSELEHTADGGTIYVELLSGFTTTEHVEGQGDDAVPPRYEQNVAPARPTNPAHEPTGVPAVLAPHTRKPTEVDVALKGFDIALPFIFLLAPAFAVPILAPTLPGAFSESIIADGDNTVGLFVATLGWSLGCAASVFIIASKRLANWGKTLLVCLALVASNSFATYIGIGEVDFSSDEPPGLSGDGSLPAQALALGAAIMSALFTGGMRAYGSGGLLLGIVCGVLAGMKAHQTYERFRTARTK